MKIPRTVTLAAIAVLALVLSAGALAQDGLLSSLVQPQVVNIEQQVPVDVTLALPQQDGTVVTTTVPLTVGIALQVKIDGAGVVSVLAGEPEQATTSQASTGTEAGASAAPAPREGQLLDLAGVPYTVSSNGDISLLQIRSKDSAGMTMVIGELRNDGDQPASYVELTIKFYDAGGNLLDVGDGYATTEEIAPGESSAFRVLGPVKFQDIASYAVEIE